MNVLGKRLCFRKTSCFHITLQRDLSAGGFGAAKVAVAFHLEAKIENFKRKALPNLIDLSTQPRRQI